VWGWWGVYGGKSSVISYQKNLYFATYKKAVCGKNLFSPICHGIIRRFKKNISVTYNVKFLISVKSVETSNKLNITIAKLDLVV
jgi:hypothetical protein